MGYILSPTSSQFIGNQNYRTFFLMFCIGISRYVTLFGFCLQRHVLSTLWKVLHGIGTPLLIVTLSCKMSSCSFLCYVSARNEVQVHFISWGPGSFHLRSSLPFHVYPQCLFHNNMNKLDMPCTLHVANNSGADFWTSGICFLPIFLSLFNIIFEQ